MNVILSMQPEHAKWLSCGLYGHACAIGVPYFLLTLWRVAKASSWMSTGSVMAHFMYLLLKMFICLTSAVSAYASYIGRWPFGYEYCQYYAFVSMFVGIANICQLTGICMERYADMTESKFYKKLGGFSFFLLNLIPLVIAAAWSSLPLLGFGRYQLEPNECSCLFNWMKLDAGTEKYLLATTVLFFVLAFGVGAVCLIGAYLRQRKAKLGAQSRKVVLNRLAVRLFLVDLIAWLPYTVAICFGLVNARMTVSLMTASQLMKVAMFSFVPPAMVKLLNAVLLPQVYSTTLAPVLKSKHLLKASSSGNGGSAASKAAKNKKKTK